ncbi:MAG TPA: hypothetical protein VM912_08400 [Terriglobales bacterium]|nr:hypothetical protein [Terriglobales bacterium]
MPAFPTLAASLLLLVAALAFVTPAQAQRGEGPLVQQQPPGIGVEQIISKFAAKEKEFQAAREHYTYHQSNIIQTLEGAGVDGEYRQDWDVNFDNHGKRTITVTYAPAPTLTRVGMTSEDTNDLQNVMPFVLTTDEIPDYNILYVGQQREDELQTYVFDISPKQIDKHHRRFQGRIWVDNRDFQIVKTYGKSVPDLHSGSDENLFPRFTTYREQIDNVYWFPTYTTADDTLHFKSGDVQIRVIIKYMDYKRFGSESKILYDGKQLPDSTSPKQFD